ncbi:hypothetical protein GALLR39Z86_19240 [Glycomyces algeriensis]|uniref:Uncharacterized protein n=1 Tax=Glycomyces algeriensis TaxID=256037 RepID=A0A9W6LGU2_9ACTN|nr:hypothetical protein GALLR39Z86_19240 [Glycomyces algeriensis]
MNRLNTDLGLEFTGRQRYHGPELVALIGHLNLDAACTGGLDSREFAFNFGGRARHDRARLRHLVLRQGRHRQTRQAERGKHTENQRARTATKSQGTLERNLNSGSKRSAHGTGLRRSREMGFHEGSLSSCGSYGQPDTD